MLSLSNVNISIGDLQLAKGFNLEMKGGEVSVLIGPNGTGKSTLLNAIFGELALDEGTITLETLRCEKKALSQWRKHIAYMPQDIKLDARLTALEVVLLGRIDALSFRIDEQMMHDAMTVMYELGIENLANRDVSHLSGGQCQMVLFAQALMRQPSLMMLDEPVSALDLHYQQVLLEQVVTRTKQTNCVTLTVLHDLNLAAQYGDNLILVKDGVVVAQGSPAQVLTNEHIYFAYGVNVEVTYDSQQIPFIRTLRRA